ncbi:phage antirepressor N-terminal domain-containing protein [Segnochrobactraceae bacterium EtOH-i3]
MTDRTITTIDFHGASLIVRAGDSPSTTLVAMKPVVEGMGLDWSAQFRKLERHPVLAKGIAMMAIPSAGGPQDMVALPLNRLHFWLATIHPTKVKPEVQERVITYQTEAADVLFEHFFGTRVAGPAPGTELVLSEEAKGAVGGIVKRCARAILREEFPALVASILPKLVEDAMLRGGHVVSTDYKPALAILKEKKILPKGRRGLVNRIVPRLIRHSLMMEKPPRTSAETGRYLFHVDVIRNWLRSEGEGIIATAVAKAAGQGVLPFPAGGRRKEKGDHEGDRA